MFIKILLLCKLLDLLNLLGTKRAGIYTGAVQKLLEAGIDQVGVVHHVHPSDTIRLHSGYVDKGRGVRTYKVHVIRVSRHEEYSRQ